MNRICNHKNRLIVNIWEKFWNLTVLELSYKWNKRIAICKCDCWWSASPVLSNLVNWVSKSCGCLKIKVLKENKTHWLSKHRIYKIYIGILNRCNNKKSKDYKHYWWRWIKCEWENVEEFIKDMGLWYKEWLSIDRINNDGNYCKENCIWANDAQQARNRRSNILYKWKCLMDVCKEKWLLYSTLQTRITFLWWSVEKAVETPIKHYNRSH